MRVLVVEDDADSLLMLSTALEAQNYIVDQAQNGLLALEKLKQNKPDLVITDILMPEMDGYALCRAIKNNKATAKIPVIIYTATYVDARDETLGMSVGASRFIIKPLEIDLFLSVVREVASEKQPGRPKVTSSTGTEDETLDEMHVDRLTRKLTKKVAELRNEQCALELSETRFRDFAETAADWFWETDATCRIVYTTSYSEILVGSSLIVFLAEARNVIFDDTRYEERAWASEAELKQRNSFRDIELEWGEASGQDRIFKVSGKPVYDESKVFMGYRGVCKDVTEASRLSRRIEHEASHDSLTGLINRSEFELRLKHAVLNHKKYGTPYQLCFMDLDQFKVVNDTAGHIAGDEMLRQISALMQDNLRHRDTLARLGGDEFGLLFENCPQEKAVDIAETLVGILSQFKFIWKEQSFKAGVSIGIVEISEKVASSTELLSQADVACYAAKDAGRNRVSVYHGKGVAHAAHEEMFRAAQINDVLESGKLILHAQPIVPCNEDDSLHLEFLIRLMDGDNLLTPDAIIPAAERYGVMSTIDRWVVEQALKVASGQFTKDDDVVVSINLSGKSFGDLNFLDELVQLISDTNLLPEQICFEITETAVVTDLSSAVDFINKLKAQGCKFALDDFGSGACSFTYLKELPVDYVKIDGSFVKGIVDSPIDKIMVESVVHIARVMGIKTIAEWVETEAANTILKAIGVDYCQGYLHGKPDRLDKMMASLNNGK